MPELNARRELSILVDLVHRSAPAVDQYSLILRFDLGREPPFQLPVVGNILKRIEHPGAEPRQVGGAQSSGLRDPRSIDA